MARQPIGFMHILVGEFMNGNVTGVNWKLHNCGLEWEREKPTQNPWDPAKKETSEKT